MEGSPDNPILLNPMRRNVPAHIRNKDQFPNLDSWKVDLFLQQATIFFMNMVKRVGLLLAIADSKTYGSQWAAIRPMLNYYPLLLLSFKWPETDFQFGIVDCDSDCIQDHSPCKFRISNSGPACHCIIKAGKLCYTLVVKTECLFASYSLQYIRRVSW